MADKPMERRFPFFCALIGAMLFLGGCSHVAELSKTLWGSSTRALEKSRAEAISKTYACDYSACFDSLLAVAKEKELTVFIKDRRKSRVVLMHIPGSIETTEVGVFFLSFGPQETKLEIASLSQSARDVVAEMIFSALAKNYSEVK